MYFNLTTQELSGPGSENITEVRWSGAQVFINGVAYPTKEVVVRGADVMHVKKKVDAIRADSKAAFFLLLSNPQPIFLKNGYQSRVVYAEV